MKRLTVFWALIAVIFLSACAQDMEMRLDTVRNGYHSNSYMASAEQFSGKRSIEKQDNLQLLVTADALFHENQFDASDAAYEEFNKRNIDLTSGSLGREAGALLGGNMANSYRPYMMDALFVSYYQIWAALADGRPNDARVIINQSYDRQKNMSLEYEKLIEETKESAAENYQLANDLSNENHQWGAYRDVMNPALTYLSGVYFLNTGKFGDAKTYLKRASGMMPDNKYVQEDLNAANAGAVPGGVTWVFIESGFAPKLIEERIDIPLSVGNGFSVMSLATSRPIFFEDGPYISSSQLLTSVDSLFMTEYGQYRINEAMRAFASAAAKAALQATLTNSDNQYMQLAGILATAYSMTSTSAEVRTWATLPKNIYLLRVKKSKSGLLELKSGGNVIAEIDVPASGNHLVYVRLGGNALDAKVIKIK